MRTVRQYLSKRKETVGSATLICEIRALKRYSKWWADLEDQDDPLAALKYPKQAESQPGVIVEDQNVGRALTRLKNWSECRWNSRDYALIRLLQYTGMRRSEIARMKVEHVDLENRLIQVPTTKNGVPRTVPIATELGRSLRNWLRWRERNGIDSEWLWVGERGGPLKPDSISGILERISNRYEITPVLRTHQFRRGLATKLAKAGVQDDFSMAILGWKSMHMPARYRAAQAKELAAEKYLAIMDPDRHSGPHPKGVIVGGESPSKSDRGPILLTSIATFGEHVGGGDGARLTHRVGPPRLAESQGRHDALCAPEVAKQSRGSSGGVWHPVAITVENRPSGRPSCDAHQHLSRPCLGTAPAESPPRPSRPVAGTDHCEVAQADQQGTLAQRSFRH